MEYGVYEVINVDEFSEDIHLKKVATSFKDVESGNSHIKRFLEKNPTSTKVFVVIQVLEFISNEPTDLDYDFYDEINQDEPPF